MKHFFKFLLLLVCSTMVMNVFAQSADNEDEVIKIDQWNRNAYRPNEVIVHFKEDGAVKMRAPRRAKFQTSAVNAVDHLFATLGVDSVEELMPRTGTKPMPKRVRTFNGKDIEPKPLGKLYRLKLAENSNQNVFQAIEQLKQLEEVDYAEPNYLVFALGAETALEDEISLPIYSDKKAYISKSKQNATNDSAIYVQEPLYSQQWGIEAINLHKLWNKPKITTKRPVIAILDTGVDIEHPDLAANIWTNETEANGIDGQDDDANGFKDDIHGWDFINQTGIIRDFNGHGTHCAGIAAAVGDNGIGITGANPDALIMPISVLQSDGSGDIATIVKGIDYAIANGADIISMSLGSMVYSIAEEQVLGRAYTNSLLVAAAGNSGLTINQLGCMFPAAFTFVFGVEASKDNYNRARFSNYDDDGPIYSMFSEEQLYNYELRAPGVNMLSTFPQGRYKSLNGTSMACPLVAGALSRLLQTKEYLSKELLFGDIIHTRPNLTGNIDLIEAYNIEEADRKPMLWLIGFNTTDTVGGDGDGLIDAGDEINVFPIFRNCWGLAENIRYWFKNGFDFSGDWMEDDTTLITFLTDTVQFGWPLSSYAKSVAKNPLRFKINPNCPDGRHINITFEATCDNIPDTLSLHLSVVVVNGVEIGGMVTEDLTLYPNVHYIVTKNLVVPEGRTLTILPGTKLRFFNNTSILSEGKVIANGTPNEKLIFEPYNSGIWGMRIGNDTVQYANIVGINRPEGALSYGCFIDCDIMVNLRSIGPSGGPYFNGANFYRCNFQKNVAPHDGKYKFCNANLVYYQVGAGTTNDVDSCNVFSNDDIRFIEYNIRELTLPPIYYGRSNLSKINVKDVNSGYYFGRLDFSNMLTQPVRETHGIVWKVVINGYDAQDEFDQMPPLGVGRHKCEVYFNRPMDTIVTPFVSYGVRPPYTQHVIDEAGVWSTDSMVYTAYFTITGKTVSDGLNRLYVADAQDDEQFEIPLENERFNMQIAAAGSMSTGLMAEAGLGKVTLTWETDEEDFEDLLGYNIYRWSDDTMWISSVEYKFDTICINSTLIDASDSIYIDYDVMPGKDYYYVIRQMTTSLESYDLSNAVVARPLTAIKGDANGSMSVDVADVITEVNYITHQNPQPFIFEAADVNNDNAINIFDVVGTINIIRHPEAQSNAVQENDALYYIENGILYVESDAVLGGVQFTFAVDSPHVFTPLDALNGFEMVSEWTNSENYLFMAYSMSGKTIGVGKNALLQIGDAELTSIALSDTQGHNVNAIPRASTALDGTVFMPNSSKYIQDGNFFIKLGDRIYNAIGTLIK